MNNQINYIDDTRIQEETEVRNWEKYFWEYEAIFKDISAKTEVFYWNQTNPTVSILIPSFKRNERTEKCIEYLLKSMDFARVKSELIVIDNYYSWDLKELMSSIAKKYANKISKIVYHHNPRLIQSTMRNFALSELSDKNSKFFASIDNDIYLSEKSINKILWFFKDEIYTVLWLSIPLWEYFWWDIEDFFHENLPINEEFKEKLIMPWKIWESIWYFNKKGNFLQTTLLRWFMFYSKEIFQTLNDPTNPWNKHFTVWQNILFHIEVNELKAKVWYLTDPWILALHDSRYDDFSVSDSNYIDYELFKSITILCYRNDIANSKINNRFIEFTKGSLKSHFKLKDGSETKLFNKTLKIAEILKKSESFTEFCEIISTENIFDCNLDDRFIKLIKKTIEMISYSDTVFNEIKNIKSHDINQPIYHIKNKIDEGK